MLKKIARFGLLGSAAVLLFSCSGNDQDGLYRVNRLLMGTYVQITLPGTSERVKEAAQAVVDEIKRVEDLTSCHKPSDLTAINDASGRGPLQINEELLGLLREGLTIAGETGGTFDPTVGPLTRLWDFSAGEPRLPERSEIEKAVAKVGWKRIRIAPATGTVFLPEAGMALDLGAVAKGYALDRAAAVIRQFGLTGGLVNAGGDVLALGEKGPGKPWRVGVQDPRDGKSIIAVAALKNRVIVTSGDYERFFIKDGTRYHHILDPRTGYPAQGLRSVTIVANRGVTADAVATAVFVLGPKRGLELIETMKGVEGLVIDSDAEIRMSSGAAPLFQIMR